MELRPENLASCRHMDQDVQFQSRICDAWIGQIMMWLPWRIQAEMIIATIMMLTRSNWRTIASYHYSRQHAPPRIEENRRVIAIIEKVIWKHGVLVVDA